MRGPGARIPYISDEGDMRGVEGKSASVTREVGGFRLLFKRTKDRFSLV